MDYEDKSRKLADAIKIKKKQGNAPQPSEKSEEIMREEIQKEREELEAATDRKKKEEKKYKGIVGKLETNIRAAEHELSIL